MKKLYTYASCLVAAAVLALSAVLYTAQVTEQSLEDQLASIESEIEKVGEQCEFVPSQACDEAEELVEERERLAKEAKKEKSYFPPATEEAEVGESERFLEKEEETPQEDAFIKHMEAQE